MKRLLITGAGGNLGRMARSRLTHLAETIRLSDVAEMAPQTSGEEVVPCDLADFAAVKDLVDGCDGIVHFGGMSVENTFDVILDANIRGLYNVYEAARQTGCRRIVFASSNHAIGFHERETRLDADSVLRPDSLYGVSKCFGEAVARLYYDKFGIETAIVRIGSCFDEPKDRRMLATWLSADDFVSLIERVFAAPRLGCPIIYGASDNDESWWDNSKVAYLGWRPKDNAEKFRAKFAGDPPDEGTAPAVRFQGGGFAAKGHFED
ncbi:NAD-dependent epimerase/dehydratase family protein [Pararhizobium haloflavum]|uniref:NAD-dependent epimerase/dehydratase family protein n=1 Tax=Pararhizobium haloflavum TaxID=2037914 RepID=UPI000C19EAF1|nr:NAD(P)-dependent oxidoreductase [Pararhizobium haloflavum]